MKYIDAEKLKAEIERRIALHDSLASNAESEMIANLEIGAAQALEDILPFLSTLESEKPSDGLEKEIDRLWKSFADEMEGPHNLFDVYARLARHFAEWGAEHLKK